jgi:ATP-dependent RNA helicase DeaD
MSDNLPLFFTDLGLSEAVLGALKDVGYETPSPIQAATIPHIIAGSDVLGQAQTGTGKTAAFALPILSKIDPTAKHVQVLILAPTRELAIQVAEACQKYASKMPGFHVLPIYGGQSYGPQLSALKRGVQVVVGTPGRIMDHLHRKTLQLEKLSHLVLDEADEMLRMGFIDDVEAILRHTPDTRQVALFSATMPPEIRKIAQTYLKNPVEVTIKSKTTTAVNIRQRYWLGSHGQKLDALTRILEAEEFDGLIIFARTKIATEELAQKLEARGFAVAALNGDIAQAQRERTIQRLKDGDIDIIVATDVAARGLDVERISHVFNYDIPTDNESYVHRIGRTGRAGRSGEAILFVTPRERNLLRNIERATKQPIEPMSLPTIEAVNEQRITKFKQSITEALATPSNEAGLFQGLLNDYCKTHEVGMVEVAAALAQLLQGDSPLLMDKNAPSERLEGARDRKEGSGFDRQRDTFRERDDRGERPRKQPSAHRSEAGMGTYRVEVGYRHGLRPGSLVGAIANEADLESKFIGRIEILDDYSLIDLPENMPADMQQHLHGVFVSGQRLRIRAATPEDFQAQSGGGNGGGGYGRERPRSFDDRGGARKPHRKGPRD